MRGRPDHYVLNPDHSITPVEVDLGRPETLLAWAQAVWGDGAPGRPVAVTEASPGVRVSTVFIGLDHNYSDKGPPLCFETMIFDDYGSGDCWRWATWDEAVAGHEKAVAGVERAARLAKRKPILSIKAGESKQ